MDLLTQMRCNRGCVQWSWGMKIPAKPCPWVVTGLEVLLPDTDFWVAWTRQCKRQAGCEHGLNSTSYWDTWRLWSGIIHLSPTTCLKMLGYSLLWDVDEITWCYYTAHFTLVFSNIRFLAVIEAEMEVCIRFKFLPISFPSETSQTLHGCLCFKPLKIPVHSWLPFPTSLNWPPLLLSSSDLRYLLLFLSL